MKELKEMVMGVDKGGMGVILDGVYKDSLDMKGRKLEGRYGDY